uniref:Aminotransferase n=1 Tax=Thermodesulfovibrio aggregans TaxID=86166 RepID=A0A7C4AIS8_9BACT
MEIQYAERIRTLPPYLFAAIDQMKRESISKGTDLIDLSIGDPDIPTPKHIVDAMKKAVENPEHHRYPSYEGMLLYRQAVSRWYKRRFNIELDPEKEVLSLIGSKEGIGHIPLAFVDPGDIVLVPSPGYPVYPVGTKFAGGVPYFMPLREENNFFPDIDSIPEDVCKKAKLMFINYPNNPTAAVATEDFFKKVIDFAKKFNIIVCHDAAYSEIYYEGKPISFMQVDGAKEVGIEFHSFSKTYNMTGWRIGYAVGNKDILSGLGKVKTNLDSGVFQAIQEAGIVALDTDDSILSRIRETYRERRDILCEGLLLAGLNLRKPLATFYVWVKIPRGTNSIDFVAKLLKEAEVLCTPGVGFGEHGEGYIRFALTQSKERIKEAVERIRRISL